jgi:hypothetical protein
MDVPPAAENTGEITGLLRAWGGGDQGALQRLAPLISDELRKVAWCSRCPTPSISRPTPL